MARITRPAIEMMSATWVVFNEVRNRPLSTSEAGEVRLEPEKSWASALEASSQGSSSRQ